MSLRSHHSWANLILRLCVAGVLSLAGCASPPPTSVPVAGMEQSVVVEDPRVYQQLFQQIERARFIREAIQPTPTSSRQEGPAAPGVEAGAPGGKRR